MNISRSTLLVLALPLLAACAVPAPEPTGTPAPTATQKPILATNVEDIIGIWKASGRGGGADVFYQFSEDGTYAVARGAPENLEDQQYVQGNFRFEGSQLLLTPTTLVQPDPTCVDATAAYEVQLAANGSLIFVLIEDTCERQVNVLVGEWKPYP